MDPKGELGNLPGEQAGSDEQNLDSGDLFSNLLSGLMGGDAPRATQSKVDELAHLLNAMLGGAAQSGTPDSPPGEAISPGGDQGDQVLGRLSGQDAAPPIPGEMTEGSASDPLGGLLGVLMGAGGAGLPGSAMNSGDQLAALLGSLMGNMGAARGMETAGGAAPFAELVTPVSEGLVEKLGIPRDVARMVVTFAISKTAEGVPGGQPAGSQSGPVQELMQRLENGQGVDRVFLNSSGMVNELAKETGMDKRTTGKSLQQVFGALGEQMAKR